MSSELLIRGFFAFILSISFACSIYSKDLRERNQSNEDDLQRYQPYISPYLYPLITGILFVLSWMKLGTEEAIHSILVFCFDVFLQISLYYLILLFIMPLLRKYIHSRVCAVLWILPNLLYFIHHGFMRLPKPLFVIQIPNHLTSILIWMWGIGFMIMMTWGIVSHFCYRRKILKHSRQVKDNHVLELWERVQQEANIKKTPYRLVISSAVTTPLSIGFFKRTIRVVLPEKVYSDEELLLIFKHEIIHLEREDSATKFYMVFCTAMCWFNPIMWFAMRKSAEDLELSCDETVLLNADERTRRKYADLILKSAGSERGFTTCLSASANSLRYRLKNIMKPQKHYVGGILAGLIFFALIMSCGHIALAYENHQAGDLLFKSEDLSAYEIKSINSESFDGATRFIDCSDAETLNQYLGSLSVVKMTGNYSFSEDEQEITIIYEGPEGVFGVALSDSILKITPLYSKEGSSSYYVLDEINWGHIISTLIGYEVQEGFLPFPPECSLEFQKENLLIKEDISVIGMIASIVEKNEEIKQESWEDFESKIKTIELSQPCGIKLLFSHDVYTDYIIQVETWDRNSIEFIDSNEFKTFELKPYDAHYTIIANFREGETIFNMEFKFDVKILS